MPPKCALGVNNFSLVSSYQHSRWLDSIFKIFKKWLSWKYSHQQDDVKGGKMAQTFYFPSKQYISLYGVHDHGGLYQSEA